MFQLPPAGTSMPIAQASQTSTPTSKKKKKEKGNETADCSSKEVGNVHTVLREGSRCQSSGEHHSRLEEWWVDGWVITGRPFIHGTRSTKAGPAQFPCLCGVPILDSPSLSVSLSCLPISMFPSPVCHRFFHDLC